MPLKQSTRIVISISPCRSIVMTRARRVVCTGTGVVSPLGVGAQKSWSALIASKSGIVRLREEDGFPGGQSKVAAYVPISDYEDVVKDSKHNYMVKYGKQLSRPTKLAMLAAHEALDNARLLDGNGEVYQQFRQGCGVAVGQGMVDFDDIYENGSLVKDPAKNQTGFRKMSPYFITRALINMSAGNISMRYKINGPNHCVSTACATGAHSLGDAYNFIRFNKADVMVCGSTEASINSIAMAGFERLKALCTRFNDEPHKASRPFDEGRGGFVMGEGAGIVVLEELNHAKRRGIRDEDIYCELLGYGTSADAHHLTAPDPQGAGAIKCMREAMNDGNISPNRVSHVNAHATSTPLGDDIELRAIEESFFSADSNRDQLFVTSCKSAIGHLLGGAGSVETIFAMLSCYNSIIPHCLNLDKPIMTRKNLTLVRDKQELWKSDERILVKNSFGFGGTNASIVLSNYLPS